MATANLSTIDYWSHPSQPTLTIGHPSGPNHQFDLNTGGSVFAFAYASDHTNFATDPPTPGSF